MKYSESAKTLRVNYRLFLTLIVIYLSVGMGVLADTGNNRLVLKENYYDPTSMAIKWKNALIEGDIEEINLKNEREFELVFSKRKFAQLLERTVGKELAIYFDDELIELFRVRDVGESQLIVGSYKSTRCFVVTKICISDKTTYARIVQYFENKWPYSGEKRLVRGIIRSFIRAAAERNCERAASLCDEIVMEYGDTSLSGTERTRRDFSRWFSVMKREKYLKFNDDCYDVYINDGIAALDKFELHKVEGRWLIFRFREYLF